jgi:5-methylcytosine-specific restriction endonuclease McrA
MTLAVDIGMSGKWITPERRRGIYARDEHTCLYCETHADELKGTNILTLDHVLARHNGGSNTSDNLVTSCKSCNSSKADRSMRVFYATLRARGINTGSVSRRIHSQRRRPVSIARGKEIVAARKAA